MAELYGNIEIVETTQITDEGKIIRVYRVKAQTVSKVSFTLEIPEDEFNAEVVSERLTARAKQIEEIKSL